MRSSSTRLLALAVAVVALVLASAFLVEEDRPYVVTAIDYHFHDAHPERAQRDDPGARELAGRATR
jgi:hypothetical protein